jgi:hypothetical protein
MVLPSLQSRGQSSNTSDLSVRMGTRMGSFDHKQSTRGTIQRRCAATQWQRCLAGQPHRNVQEIVRVAKNSDRSS